MRFDDFHLKLTSFIQDRVCFGRGGGGLGVYTEKKFFLCLKSQLNLLRKMAMTDLICFKILVFRNNWIRFCAKILIVNSKLCYVWGGEGCMFVCVGGGGGWVWLQEGNDIVVTENVLQIILLRRMTMIDRYKKKKLLFTHNWIRSCVTIVINNLQAMFETGWWRAIGKSYSCDGKLSLDTSAGMNDNN